MAGTDLHKNIIILGMHRSGTSACAGLLNQAGYFTGDDPLPSDPGFNDRGFFEDRQVVALHDAILERLGVSWHDTYYLLPSNFDTQNKSIQSIDTSNPDLTPELEKLGPLIDNFTKSSPWCIKDPRLCILLPLWQGQLDQRGVSYQSIVMVRSPQEVMNSLAARDQFESAKSLMLWLDYYLAAERHTRGTERIFVQYSDLIAADHSRVRESFLQIGIDIPESALASSVDSSLQHFRSEDPAPTDLLKECYTWLCRLATDSETTGSDAAFDQMSQQFEQLKRLTLDARPLVREVQSVTEKLNSSQIHIKNIDALNAKMGEKLAQQDHELSLATAQNKGLQAELETVTNQEKQLQTAVENAEETIKQLTSESTLQQRSLQDAQGKIKRLHAEVESGHTESLALASALRRTKLALEETREILAVTTAEAASGQSELARVRSDLAMQHLEINAFKNSFFWRSTALLRWLTNTCRQLAQSRFGFAQHQIALKPHHQIQIENGDYVSTGDDPQFLLVSDQGYAPFGRVVMDIELGKKSSVMKPVLYITHGITNQLLEMQLPVMHPGPNSIRLTLPGLISQFRLDPDSAPGRFDIREVTIHHRIV